MTRAYRTNAILVGVLYGLLAAHAGCAAYLTPTQPERHWPTPIKVAVVERYGSGGEQSLRRLLSNMPRFQVLDSLGPNVVEFGVMGESVVHADEVCELAQARDVDLVFYFEMTTAARKKERCRSGGGETWGSQEEWLECKTLGWYGTGTLVLKTLRVADCDTSDILETARVTRLHKSKELSRAEQRVLRDQVAAKLEPGLPVDDVRDWIVNNLRPQAVIAHTDGAVAMVTSEPALSQDSLYEISRDGLLIGTAATCSVNNGEAKLLALDNTGPMVPGDSVREMGVRSMTELVPVFTLGHASIDDRSTVSALAGGQVRYRMRPRGVSINFDVSSGRVGSMGALSVGFGVGYVMDVLPRSLSTHVNLEVRAGSVSQDVPGEEDRARVVSRSVGALAGARFRISNGWWMTAEGGYRYSGLLDNWRQGDTRIDEARLVHGTQVRLAGPFARISFAYLLHEIGRPVDTLGRKKR